MCIIFNKYIYITLYKYIPIILNTTWRPTVAPSKCAPCISGASRAKWNSTPSSVAAVGCPNQLFHHHFLYQNCHNLGLYSYKTIFWPQNSTTFAPSLAMPKSSGMSPAKAAEICRRFFRKIRWQELRNWGTEFAKIGTPKKYIYTIYTTVQLYYIIWSCIIYSYIILYYIKLYFVSLYYILCYVILYHIYIILSYWLSGPSY